jgi:hypothetical protein
MKFPGETVRFGTLKGEFKEVIGPLPGLEVDQLSQSQLLTASSGATLPLLVAWQPFRLYSSEQPEIFEFLSELQ